MSHFYYLRLTGCVCATALAGGMSGSTMTMPMTTPLPLPLIAPPLPPSLPFPTLVGWVGCLSGAAKLEHVPIKDIVVGEAPYLWNKNVKELAKVAEKKSLKKQNKKKNELFAAI